MEFKPFGLTGLSIVISVVLFKLLQMMNYLPNPHPVHMEISLGKLVGTTGISRNGRIYNSFTRIPYAKPPIGNLRFKSPVQAESWPGILDASKAAPDCMQIEPTLKFLQGQEDCLYLNIYYPKMDESDASETKRNSRLLPVIAYIHGGHYMFGGSKLLSPAYFMDEDIVFVTFNYRLGALGFLNTGDGTVSGNMGLRDQVKALEFIQEYIHHFHGDKNSLTLMGSSAGGSSVNFHMLSDMSRGLFHKAISHSGSSLSPWGFTRTPKEQAQRLGLRMGCSNVSSNSLLACLMNKTAEEIIETQRETLDMFHVPEAIYAPSVESLDQAGPIFLTDSPHKLLKAGKFHKIPYIIGVTSEEGCYRTPVILNSPEKLGQLNNNWNEVVRNTLILYKNVSDEIPPKIRKFYFGESNPTIGFHNMENLTNAYSDRYFVSGVREAAILHSKDAPTFLYYFTYKGDYSAAPILKATARDGAFFVVLDAITEILKNKVYRLLGWEVIDYGVCHVDCQFHFFPPLPFLSIAPGSKHYEFSRSLIGLWARFANHSTDLSITPQLNFDEVEWMPLKYKTNVRYLHFGNLGSKMIDEPFTQRLEFWKSLNLAEN